MQKNDDIETEFKQLKSSQPFNPQFFQMQAKQTNYRSTGSLPGPNKVIAGPREKASSAPIKTQDKDIFIDPAHFQFRRKIVEKLRGGEVIENSVLEMRDNQFKR